MDEKIWRTIRASMAAQAGDDNPSRVARNIVFALRDAGFSIVPTPKPDFGYLADLHAGA